MDRGTYWLYWLRNLIGNKRLISKTEGLEMSDVNRVILVGRVGSDPETRNIGRGEAKEIAEFSLATSRKWRDSNGERKEKTAWHKIKIMNDSLVKNVVRPYVKKGSLLYIEGEIEYEQWEDRQTGEKKYATKIVVNIFGGSIQLMGGGNSEGGERSGGNRQSDYRSTSGGSGQARGQSRQPSFSEDMNDDDIPF